MWKKDKPEMDTPRQKKYYYFSLKAMVGVGAKGRNNIKSVHIRFVLVPMHHNLSEPEVVSICPTNISRTVGEIKEMQKYENERGVGGGVNASGGYGSTIAGIFGSIGARFRKQFSSSKIKESTLPNELLIANASGTANRAIWEFYRGDGVEAIGQYNLEIIFRLRDYRPDCPPYFPLYKKKFCYCVDWNIEVNGRKLWDHKVERENKRWNVVFNCKKLMDHTDVKEPFMCRINDTFSWETIDLKSQQSSLMKLTQPLMKLTKWLTREQTGDYHHKVKTLKTLKKVIQVDDQDIDKRLLRPLMLLDSSEKEPPSPNPNPSRSSSWITKIKDIEHRPSLLVKATVLSNPKQIKKPKNSNPNTKDAITYVLLGDETGLTVLIEEAYKESSKLNRLKKDDSVIVIGAERKEVCYRDLEDLQPILKYRQTDLYVNKFTCIKNSKDEIDV
jgi:hypothetical protein